MAWGSFQWEMLKNGERPCRSHPDAVILLCETRLKVVPGPPVSQWHKQLRGKGTSWQAIPWILVLSGGLADGWMTGTVQRGIHCLQQQIKQLGWRSFVWEDGMCRCSVLNTYLWDHWQHCICSLGRCSSILLTSHGCKGKLSLLRFLRASFPRPETFLFLLLHAKVIYL